MTGSKGNSEFYFPDTLASIKNTIILLVCPSKIFDKCRFYFLLGLTIVPRETGNNAYAKFWRDEQRVLWYFWYWVVGCGRIKEFKLVLHQVLLFSVPLGIQNAKRVDNWIVSTLQLHCVSLKCDHDHWGLRRNKTHCLPWDQSLSVLLYPTTENEPN